MILLKLFPIVFVFLSSIPFGEEMLTGKLESQKWQVETDDNTICMKRQRGNVFRFEVKKNGKESWHPLLIARRLTLEAGKTYTFLIKAKADKPDKVSIGIRRDEKDYGNLGFSANLSLTTEWQTFTLSFIPKESCNKGRFDIGSFQEGNAYEFINASLRPGGNVP